MLKLLSLKRILDEKGIFLYFDGLVSQELLIQLGDILKQKMKMGDVKSGTILKVFSLFVEQAQNIIHYTTTSADPADSLERGESQMGVLIVGNDGRDYFIGSGNTINNDEVDSIREKLEIVRAMNKDELKAYYREMRRKESPEKSKGAGLGFIEMARSASKPLEYDFSAINDRESFFTLITTIVGE